MSVAFSWLGGRSTSKYALDENTGESKGELSSVTPQAWASWPHWVTVSFSRLEIVCRSSLNSLIWLLSISSWI